MDILPINQNIVIEVDKTGDVTAGGVHSAHDKRQRTESIAIKGTVIDIAEDLEELHLDRSSAIEKYVSGKPKVKVGDTVWLEKWNGQKVTLNGKEYIFIRQEFICGILKK